MYNELFLVEAFRKCHFSNVLQNCQKDFIDHPEYGGLLSLTFIQADLHIVSGSSHQLGRNQHLSWYIFQTVRFLK